MVIRAALVVPKKLDSILIRPESGNYPHNSARVQPNTGGNALLNILGKPLAQTFAGGLGRGGRRINGGVGIEGASFTDEVSQFSRTRASL